MQYSIDSERRLRRTITPLVGQDLTRVEPGTVLRWNQSTEIYPALGSIYDVLQAYDTVEEFVEKVIAPQDSKYVGIGYRYHTSMGQDEIIAIGRLQDQREAELVVEVKALIEQVIGGHVGGIIYMMSEQQIVLSQRQEALLQPVEGSAVRATVVPPQRVATRFS